MIDHAGLRVIHTRYFFHWLFPAKLIVRSIEGIWPGEPRPTRVPPSAINRMLLSICLLEQGTWGRLRLPFGASLLCVAET